ncbi:MAG: hypothetical protein KME18_26805 [Phormidium tanganyikae FI6-MK23]|nr:hypothetical protein [Phormidium tanganyikae FI6-MK23]
MFNSPETRSKSIKAKLSLLSLICMGTVFPLVGFPQKTLAQPTALPMSISLGDINTFFLIVPDRDVSQSAYGGKLRRRDVHVAKMFEVTQHFCKTEPSRARSYDWIYEKNGGSTSLPDTRRGIFRISCGLANDIAIAYGAGKPESTTIDYDRRLTPRFRTYSIPILNITGGKVDTWLRFMSSFKSGR